MMDRVNINLGKRSYQIIINSGILEQCGEFLARLGLGEKILLVTNPTVYSLYGSTMQKSLREFGFKVTAVEVPDGEEYKNLQQAEKLYDAAFSAGLDRGCPVVALGGGVIGDLAGFVASTYMRGVPFVQVPTTLLAQVDSSVGGKVAVNHPRGKNIIGAFYQPSLVLADLQVLKTLPPRELRAGLAEVIKYGIIRDGSFFEWLEANLELLLQLDYEALAVAVKQSCQIKARVVEEDETEQGVRAILNFGHTVGHALESLTSYKVYRHGEAVAVGMVAASRMAERMGLFGTRERERVEKIISRAGLPTEIPPEINTPELVRCFYSDKKVMSENLTFVLPVKIGQVIIDRNLAEENLLRMLVIKRKGGKLCVGHRVKKS